MDIALRNSNSKTSKILPWLMVKGSLYGGKVEVNLGGKPLSKNLKSLFFQRQIEKDVVQPVAARNRGKKRRLDTRMTGVWAYTDAPSFAGGFLDLTRFLGEEDDITFVVRCIVDGFLS